MPSKVPQVHQFPQSSLLLSKVFLQFKHLCIIVQVLRSLAITELRNERPPRGSHNADIHAPFGFSSLTGSFLGGARWALFTRYLVSRSSSWIFSKIIFSVSLGVSCSGVSFCRASCSACHTCPGIQHSSQHQHAVRQTASLHHPSFLV